MLAPEGGFEITFSFINLDRKGLVYLKAQVNGSNMIMLIDTKITIFS